MNKTVFLVAAHLIWLVCSCAGKDGGAGVPTGDGADGVVADAGTPDVAGQGDIGGVDAHFPDVADAELDDTVGPPDVVDNDALTDVQAIEPLDTTDLGDSGADTVAVPVHLGLPLANDGVTWVGVASVDITPDVPETYTDLDGDSEFDGCLDDPTGTLPGCLEPFDDANGNGHFDAVWIGGFGTKRAAQGVHDPLFVRSIVIARNGEYLVLTGMDLVALMQLRIDAARDRLVAEDGMDEERLVVSASHTHQGPDTIGIWGFSDLDTMVINKGYDEAFQERVTDGIVESVRAAAKAVQPAEILMGQVRMRDRSPWYNGAAFGGTNPDAHVHGLTHDIRDPIIVSDNVFLMLARNPETKVGIASFLNYSGHPETWGGNNTQISSDWVGVARTRIEAALGGMMVFMPECLGGMQSMLGGPVPLVDEDGAWVMEPGDGGDVPVWAESGTWDMVRSSGMHVAAAALAALEGAAPVVLEPLSVARAKMHAYVNNQGWTVISALGVLDADLSMLAKDPEDCPEYTGGFDLGCFDTYTWRLRLGPLSVATAPGELLPEVFHGVPDSDPVFVNESTHPEKRGAARGSVYFPQHDPDCDGVPYEQCRTEYDIGECNCLSTHDVPYAASPDPVTLPPIVTLLPKDAEYKILLGSAGDYLSYMIPENDFNRKVSLIDGPEGDHYEETVSAGSELATALVKAQLSL